MNPRPFHRWKSLWLGIFVACFIVWAWRDSMRFRSSVTWQQACAENHGGGVAVGHLNPRLSLVGPLVTPTPRWNRYAPDFEIASPVFAAPFLFRGDDATLRDLYDAEAVYFERSYHDSLAAFMEYQPRGDWLLFIPHWLVMLAFVGPWAVFLIRRLGRQRTPIP